jgi:hypothetical protein
VYWTNYQIREDFPAIEKPGVFPPDALQYGPGFASLLSEIQSPEIAEAVGEKLGVDLKGLPVTITVRGKAQSKDGRMGRERRPAPAAPQRRRSGGLITEIPPNGGTFVAFKVSHNSRQGHKPFVGERRYGMVNSLCSEVAHARQLGRQKLSAKVKRLVLLLEYLRSDQFE